MPRIGRQWISQEVGSLHIISRIAGDLRLLKREEKEYLVELIQTFSQGYFVRVHAYCIMGNHFHILATGMELDALYSSKEELIRRYKFMFGKDAEPPQGGYDGNGIYVSDPDGGIGRLRKRLGSISRFVQDLKQTFTRWYNKRKDRTGYLWGSRFKGVVIFHGVGQLIVSSYIDLNPVRAGIVKCPEDYEWSSFGFRTASPVKAKSFLHPIAFEDEWEESREAYRVLKLTKSDEWKSLAWYRVFVYISGGVEREGKASIPQYLIDGVIACNGHLGISGRLRSRIKNFSRGIAVGSYQEIAELQEKLSRKFIRPRTLPEMQWAHTTRVLRG